VNSINTKEELEHFVCKNWNDINVYLDKLGTTVPLPIYTSVDIRESKEQFAPVDNNLYPAGFNNICQLDLNVCADRLNQYIKNIAPKAKRLILIPESHTKNKFYLDGLSTLKNCLEKNGLIVDLKTPDPHFFASALSDGLINDINQNVKLESYSQNILEVGKCDLEMINSYDGVILHNDQSDPLPIDWVNVTVPVLPTPFLGWTKRQKTEHFKYYAEIVDQFCQHFQINPRLISAKFLEVTHLDFNEKEGIDLLANAVDELQVQIGRPQAPVFIKSSQGTYGMGISVVTSSEEVRQMNRKTRNKMDVGKNGLKFNQVLVQEGIETMLTVDGHPAEVTIYLIGGKSSGGFLRMNPLKDSNGNLNSKGMVYQKYCISEITQGYDHQCKEAVYCMIARLSTLATGLEILNQHKPKK